MEGSRSAGKQESAALDGEFGFLGQLFEEADKDHSDTLSFEEFTVVLKRLHVHLSEEEVRELLVHAGHDAGSVDYKSFLWLMESKAGHNEPEKVHTERVRDFLAKHEKDPRYVANASHVGFSQLPKRHAYKTADQRKAAKGSAVAQEHSKALEKLNGTSSVGHLLTHTVVLPENTDGEVLIGLIRDHFQRKDRSGQGFPRSRCRWYRHTLGERAEPSHVRIRI